MLIQMHVDRLVFLSSSEQFTDVSKKEAVQSSAALEHIYVSSKHQ